MTPLKCLGDERGAPCESAHTAASVCPSGRAVYLWALAQVP